ncbi:MAG: hypothetical protein WCY37_03455 [Candidatus Dojkabacteria bacterium]
MFNKKFFLLLFVLFPVLFTACSSSPVPWDRIEILPETNPEYLGSYRFERCWGNPFDSVCEEEYGEWTSDLELLVDQNRKICFGGFEEGRVYAQPDYEWVETRFQGRNCIQLQKKGK